MQSRVCESCTELLLQREDLSEFVQFVKTYDSPFLECNPETFFSSSNDTALKNVRVGNDVLVFKESKRSASI